MFIGLFMLVSLITRFALLKQSAKAIDWNSSLIASFAWGSLFDLGAALLFSIPLILVLTLLPAGVFLQRRWARVLARCFFFVAIGALFFGVVAEWFFWDEFATRFNFIAVDYLVYTTEVVANIRESYPMPAILAALAVASGIFYFALARSGLIDDWLSAPVESMGKRYARGGFWLAAAVLVAVALDASYLPNFANTYNRELAKNGPWSLFAAFRDNELDYDQFYPTLPIDKAFDELRNELASDNSQPLGPNGAHDTLRYISNPGPEIRPNVIQVTVESLSASFLDQFVHASRLTPNLENLARKSLVFDNFYATGTRTDRGMEALTLSLPPTPGRSLIKRPNNQDLFTLGSVFRSRGYDTAFIYGGYGYFDNMNTFFGGNGYRVLDRAAVSKKDITFANAWGACDEDVYRWTLREADAAVAAGKPFHYFVMTTSNHRPYTYPDGRIDLPSKSAGRAGAVKYTDFAIGEFLKAASTKPWYNNTIFVFVADHCASVAGKTELPVQNYHIPLLVYAPGGQVAPGHIKDLTSQIDYPPTLLGLLNWSYATRFYGRDVRTAGGDRRALIGNYQKLGLYEPGQLDVLKPVRGFSSYRYDPKTFALSPQTGSAEMRNEAISYYQTASYLYKNGGYRALTTIEQANYAAQILLRDDAKAVAHHDTKVGLQTPSQPFAQPLLQPLVMPTAQPDAQRAPRS